MGNFEGRSADKPEESQNKRYAANGEGVSRRDFLKALGVATISMGGISCKETRFPAQKIPPKQGDILREPQIVEDKREVVNELYEENIDEVTKKKIESIYKEVGDIRDIGLRMQIFSGHFLKAPYKRNTYDISKTESRLNIKKFSCTTYVEQMLALARSNNLHEALINLDKIRFSGGKIEYEKIRHWPDAQWVPGLIEEGFVEDANQQIADDAKIEPGILEVKLSPELLRASLHRDLKKRLKAEHVPSGVFPIMYIPVNRVLESSRILTPGMIVNVVKRPNQRDLTGISHQGIVVRNAEGEVAIRHATPYKGIVEQSLKRFLTDQGSSVLGLHFLRPLNPKPHQAKP